MAMLGGDKCLIEAHNRAVGTAIKLIEAMASTRVMTKGRSETQLTGNRVMAFLPRYQSRPGAAVAYTRRSGQHRSAWR